MQQLQNQLRQDKKQLMLIKIWEEGKKVDEE
jgi:hypothetical protein